MENVRGRERVEGGALCERKNGRGVDPNRNWDVHWGHKEADYDPGEEFPGQGPFRWVGGWVWVAGAIQMGSGRGRGYSGGDREGQGGVSLSDIL